MIEVNYNDINSSNSKFSKSIQIPSIIQNETDHEEINQSDLNIKMICKDCKISPPCFVDRFSDGDVVCAFCGLVVCNGGIYGYSYQNEFEELENNHHKIDEDFISKSIDGSILDARSNFLDLYDNCGITNDGDDDDNNDDEDEIQKLKRYTNSSGSESISIVNDHDDQLKEPQNDNDIELEELNKTQIKPATNLGLKSKLHGISALLSKKFLIPSKSKRNKISKEDDGYLHGLRLKKSGLVGVNS